LCPTVQKKLRQQLRQFFEIYNPNVVFNCAKKATPD
jgi:hypothetical protein